MNILLLIGFFNSFLFPRNILFERQFNPAYLHQERLEIILASETRFELSELQTFGVYSQINRYSLKAVSFGSDVYRENFLEVGFGFPVARKFAFGLHVAGLNTWIKDYSNEFAYALKAGGQFESDPFIISMSIISTCRGFHRMIMRRLVTAYALSTEHREISISILRYGALRPDCHSTTSG